MTDPAGLVEQAIMGRLSHATQGLNPKYAGVIASADYVAYALDPVVIDWTATSQNFGCGIVNPDLIEETSDLIYPYVSVDAQSGNGHNGAMALKFQSFSGPVTASIYVHCAWEQSRVTNFTAQPNALIAAVYQSINDPAFTAAWPSNVSYNGDMSFTRTPLFMSGPDWRRSIQFQITFTVNNP